MAAAAGMAALVTPCMAGLAQSKAGGSGEAAAAWAGRGGGLSGSFAGLRRVRSCSRGGEKSLCFKRADWHGTTKQRKEAASVALRAANAVQDEATFEDVPHITNWLPDLPTYPNPLKFNTAYSAVKQYFVADDDIVAKEIVVTMKNAGAGVHFRRAGPRDKIYFRPEEVKACIVTCGGLCPGLNTVIREIVCGLWYQYGVHEILGIDGGFKGFYARNTLTLDPKVVNDIHKRGGTILGTSRGGHDTMKIVDSIENRGINQVYIIGGDGTHKGAKAIHDEIVRRGLKVVIAGIPKTIDNDIDVIDKSFGFDTAVEEAQRAINAAHVEAESVHNGVGVVKLMGRYSGYIAMYATLASRDVDCCLIPEVPFFMDGDDGLYEFVWRRLRENGHMVLVVAEGSGQELISESLGSLDNLSDASGNRLLLDVGLWLCQKLKDYFQNIHKESITLKYIDPTYMIRAIPSIASDNIYCTLLAHSVIHGAMAGFCGFTAGPVNNRHCYIPISSATDKQRHVNTSDRMWARLLSSTHQPNFLRYDKVIEEQREINAANRAADADNDLFGLTASHSIAMAPQSRLKKGSSNASSSRSTNGKAEDSSSTRPENPHTQNFPEQPLETTPTPGDPTGFQDQNPLV